MQQQIKYKYKWIQQYKNTNKYWTSSVVRMIQQRSGQTKDFNIDLLVFVASLLSMQH
jgi:hypothetical protein